MAINKQWHLKHKMPKNATLKQKINWHTSHAKHCTCRDSRPHLARLHRLHTLLSNKTHPYNLKYVRMTK